MATFSVPVVRLSAPSEHHPNADRLSIVRVDGFLCISAKLPDGSHRYNEGDHVAYIPEAALLPEAILRSMEFWKNGKGMLSGPNGDRVSAIALRGIVSQGVLYPIQKDSDGLLFLEVPMWHGDELLGHSRYTVAEGQDVADKLGITKYEPPVPAELLGEAFPLLDETGKFDVESIQKFTDIFGDGEPVHVTEKLHGTCIQIGYSPLMEPHPLCFLDGRLYVTQKGLGNKGLALVNIDAATGEAVNLDNRYVRTLRALLDDGFGERIKALATEQMARIRIFGEVYGRGVGTDLHYGTSEPQLAVFDIMIDREFLPPKAMQAVAERLGLRTVPELYVGPFNRAAIEAVRDGRDTMSGTHIREGVVIRSATEARHPFLGRKLAKWVSPDYLVRKGAGDEFQ